MKARDHGVMSNVYAAAMLLIVLSVAVHPDACLVQVLGLVCAAGLFVYHEKRSQDDSQV